METIQHDGLVTVGQLVAADFRKAAVFKSAGIDFCCGGHKTVQQACEEKGVDADWLLGELSHVDAQPVLPSHDYRSWSPSFLCDYIVNTHHAYVAKTVPDLLAYTAKVASVHGDRHPEMLEVALLCGQVAKELTQHMAQEEQVLFPAIKAAANGDLSGKDKIESEIARMNGEHEFAGGALDQINHLTNGYEVPMDACNTYRVALHLLEQFEDDLHLHVHLENNILFPTALALAK